MEALRKIRESGFAVALVDGYIEISPSSKLTAEQREFLKRHKAVIVSELEAETLSPSDKQKILAWLAHIGETDQAMIDDVLEQVTNDAGALAYFLKRAEEVKGINQPIHLIQCGDCQHFKSYYAHGKGSGICKAGVQPLGLCHWSGTPRTCNDFDLKSSR